MAYLLDADAFIAANNLHYGLDFCPAFCDWLVAGHESERVFSVEKVGDEVQALGDELSEWAEARGNGFFLPPDASVFPALAEVSAWATGQAYEPAAVNTFLQVADYYLVAQARAGRHTVVTHEVPSASTRKIKIPDACIGLGIKCMTPYEVAPRTRAVCPWGSLMSDQTNERAFETHVEETLLGRRLDRFSTMSGGIRKRV